MHTHAYILYIYTIHIHIGGGIFLYTKKHKKSTMFPNLKFTTMLKTYIVLG